MQKRKTLKFILFFISIPCAVILWAYYQDSNPLSYYRNITNATPAVLVADSIYVSTNYKVKTRMLYGYLQGEEKTAIHSIEEGVLCRWELCPSGFEQSVFRSKKIEPQTFTVWKGTGKRVFPRASYDNRSELLFRQFGMLILFKLPILVFLIVAIRW